MERVFVDPVFRSRKVERAQLVFILLVLLLALGALWTRWALSEGKTPIQLPVAASSVLAPALGLSYYILKRYRRVMNERLWLTVDENGLRSMTPAGLAEAGWDEIEEVRIGISPSRSNSPDVLIRTEKGYIKVLMRWMDRSGELPEPSLLASGRRFYFRDGRSLELSPDGSELVRALKEHIPPEKIKQGVIVSL